MSRFSQSSRVHELCNTVKPFLEQALKLDPQAVRILIDSLKVPECCHFIDSGNIGCFLHDLVGPSSYEMHRLAGSGGDLNQPHSVIPDRCTKLEYELTPRCARCPVRAPARLHQMATV